MGNALVRLFNFFARSKTTEKKEDQSTAVQPVYSWDRHGCEMDVNAFHVQHLVDNHSHRSLPSRGQQFKITSCSRSLITAADCFDSIFIDDCSECKIILGPVKRSVFIRNCSECVLVVACGQFRLRDSKDLIIFLHCSSQPSIESSTCIRFNCISLNYPNFKEHVAITGLDVTVNAWSNVFDFTPVDGETKQRNWTLLEPEDLLENFMSSFELLHCKKNEFNFERSKSIIPFSQKRSPKLLGNVSDVSEKYFSVVVFNDLN